MNASTPGEYKLPDIIIKWIAEEKIKERIYVLTNRGIYNGVEKSILDTSEADYNWWTFSGMVDQVILGGI